MAITPIHTRRYGAAYAPSTGSIADRYTALRAQGAFPNWPYNPARVTTPPGGAPAGADTTAGANTPRVGAVDTGTGVGGRGTPPQMWGQRPDRVLAHQGQVMLFGGGPGVDANWIQDAIAGGYTPEGPTWTQPANASTPGVLFGPGYQGHGAVLANAIFGQHPATPPQVVPPVGTPPPPVGVDPSGLPLPPNVRQISPINRTNWSNGAYGPTPPVSHAMEAANRAGIPSYSPHLMHFLRGYLG